MMNTSKLSTVINILTIIKMPFLFIGTLATAGYAIKISADAINAVTTPSEVFGFMVLIAPFMIGAGILQFIFAAGLAFSCFMNVQLIFQYCKLKRQPSQDAQALRNKYQSNVSNKCALNLLEVVLLIITVIINGVMYGFRTPIIPIIIGVVILVCYTILIILSAIDVFLKESRANK